MKLKLYTLPIEIQHGTKPAPIFEKHLKKSCSESDIELDISSNSKDCQPKETAPSSKSEIRPRIKTYFSNQFIKLKKVVKIRYLLKEVLVRNFYALLILILLIEVQIYFNQYYTCNLDNSKVYFVLYFVIRETFIFLFFYFLYGYYALFSLFNNQTKIVHVFTMNSFVFLTLKAYEVITLQNYLDLHVTNIIIGHLMVFYYYKKDKIPFKKIQKGLLVMFLLVFFLFLINHYLMKSFVIAKIKILTLRLENPTLGGILFQIFLFLYYRLYHKIFFKSLVMYSRISKKSENCKDSIIMFSKYLLLDAVTSSAPAAVCVSMLNINAWLGMFNFLYQILVLYDPNFDILRKIKNLIFRLAKRKQEEPNAHEKKVTELLSVSLNEVMIIVYLQFLLLFAMRKCINYYVLAEKCDFSIPENIQIRCENVFVLMILNSLIVMALAVRERDPLKLVWSLESYSALFQVYYIILLHSAVDFTLQFYLQVFYQRI